MFRLVSEASSRVTGSVVQILKSILCVGPLAILALLLNVSVRADGQFNNKAVDSLVRDVVHNEVQALLQDGSLWCYRQQQQEDGKPNKTLDVCQTKDGELQRVIAVNGRELDAAQRQAEDERIQTLVAHPEQLLAKQKKDREDGEQARNMLKILPDAFLFECEHESGSLITLHFQPNPAFRPATRPALVFHHLEGTLVLDTRQKRLVEINGTLTSEVRFAGGFLGHLDKGGAFAVKQQEVGDDHWDLVFMSVRMTGRALLFKTIAVSQKQTLSGYKPLPSGATLQQAADFLLRDLDVHTADSMEKTK